MKRKWLFALMAALLVLCFAVPAMAFGVEWTIKATWDDNNNAAGKRPDSISVAVTCKHPTNSNLSFSTKPALSLTQGNSWSTRLQGVNSNYTDVSASVSYTAKDYYTYTVSTDADNHIINITFKYEATNILGKITWDDASNQDGIRPDSVTVQLIADGIAVAGKTLTLNEGNNWSGSFDELPEYNNGSKIVYTVEENPIGGYACSVSGDAETGYTLSFSHTPATTSISGSIIWDDDNDRDGKRPLSMTVRLYADGVEVDDLVLNDLSSATTPYRFENLPKYAGGREITYSVTEDQVEGYASTVNNTNYTITNSYTPAKTGVSFNVAWDDANDQDRNRPESVTVQLYADDNEVTGKTLTLNAGNNWSGSFDNLPEYNNGRRIVYTVEENTFDGYTCVVSGDATSGFTITNSHTPAKTSVWCQAVWNDNNNQDVIRPTEVTVKLLADGVDSCKSLTLNAGNAWTHSFNDLPKYEYGREISYTIAVTIDDYTSAITGTTTTGYTITNSHTPDTINVAGEITWNDDNDRDRKRPASVIVRLFANTVEVNHKTVSPDADGNWSFSFDGVAKYNNGQPIQYKVYLDSLNSDYFAGTDGYNPIATRTPDKRRVYGSIIWDDDNNRDGKRPASVIVRVFQGDTELNHQTVTPDANGNWNFSFANLLKNEDGQPINYTVSMDAVDGYAKNINGYTITNTHVPTTTSFFGWISWGDDNNRDGIRPQRVTVKLYADGVYKAEKTIGAERTATAGGRFATATNWYYSFENLLVNESGRPINYTVEMDPIAGYTTAMQGGSIVNIHEPETTTFRVRKLFKGLGAGEKAPAIQLTLYCNGEEYPTSMPTPDPDGWYVYTVPKRVNGQIAVYTAKVAPIAGFVTGYENVGEYVDQTEWLYDGGTSESHRLPKTGDESQLVLWLALAAVACAGVAVLLRCCANAGDK